MSVWIKGFKMPTCCYFCPMLEINQYSEAYCEAVGESTIIKYTYGEKPDFCPLVEVEDKELSTADAQPVKYGKWILTSRQISDVSVKLPTKCSNCDFSEYNAEMYNFCPNCGARMNVIKDGDARNLTDELKR